MTSFSASITPQLFAAANGARTSLTIQNTSDAELFLGPDNTVSPTNYTYRRVFGTGYTFTPPDSTQDWYGVWDFAGSEGAVVTEITDPTSDGNSAISTYAQLKTAVAAWLRPNSSATADMTTNIPKYIGLAEVMIRRELHLKALDQTETALAIVAGSATVPTGFLSVVSMTMVDEPYNQVRMLPIDQLDKLDPLQTSGKPYYYARAGSNFRFYPRVNGTAQLRFRRGVTPLANDSDTNWVLAQNPDAYLYGALLQADRRLIGPRIGEWKQGFVEAIESIRRLEMSMHADQIVPQPSGFVV